jgi:aminoglycoside 6'-N-acetyltransferase I
MIIREATEDDSSAWVEMRTALWPESGDDFRAELAQYFAGDSIDIAEAFVIEADDGSLAGFIELNIRSYAEGSRSPRVPYVEGWYVAPQWRDKGYGKALMQRAEQWARDNGFNEIASDTGPENEKSIALHKRLGFQETDRVVCFLKKLTNSD